MSYMLYHKNFFHWEQVTRGEDLEVIQLQDDNYTLPSVVSYIGTEETLVGMPAKK